MNTVTIELANEYFYYEHLLENEKNSELIKTFYIAKQSGKGLELYLKNSSVDEEINNASRTYLVKDKTTKELIAYFSLKTGLFTIRIDDEKFNNISAIELSNFAVNSNYKRNHPKTKYIGADVFFKIIVPIVKQLQDYVGIEALYIYALPEESLIEYYKFLGFYRLEPDDEKFVHVHVKPKYDDECIFMYQII